jgi:hypothetical protein
MLTYKESIDNYYKLKSKYEEQINKIKQNLHNNPKLSIRDKKKLFNEFKPKCISCQRPVGTIFSINYNENEDFRSLLSFCGDRVNPCGLNININVGSYLLLPTLLKMNEEDIENIKNSIIIDKNKLLFGLLQTENALDNFDEFKKEINDISALYEYYLELFNDLVNNKEKKEELNKNIELLNINILSIKKAIQDYNSTGDTQFIKDAIEIYINNLQVNGKNDSITKKIQDLKYKQNYVEYDESTNTYHLIQNEVGIDNLEVDFGNPNVVSFEIGGREMVKKSKTKKSKDIFKDDKSKTKKIRKDLIIEDEENAEIESEKIQMGEKPMIKIQVKNYIINPDNTVSWSDPLYQQIWDSLDNKYKNALLKDVSWMKYTMDNYADKMKNKLQREFVLPENLIIPTTVDSDGKYNLGNEVINNIFNNAPEIQKKSLLSMISKDSKDANSNKMFLHSLGLVVGQNLGFSKY